jgi:hypothetical protein
MMENEYENESVSKFKTQKLVKHHQVEKIMQSK